MAETTVPVPIGIIALSLTYAESMRSGDRWEIPAELYPPLLQAAVVVHSSTNKVAAKAFLDYIKSNEGRSLKKYGLARQKISECNQLLGRILEIKTDDLMAQVRILSGDHELTSLITAQMAADLGLRVGDDVIVIFKSTQVMIVRGSV